MNRITVTVRWRLNDLIGHLTALRRTRVWWCRGVTLVAKATVCEEGEARAPGVLDDLAERLGVSVEAS